MSQTSAGATCAPIRQKPSIAELLALFSFVFLLGTLLSKFGLFDSRFASVQNLGFFAAVVLGLVAGSTSCMAVAGGLLLSSSAAFRAAYGDGTPMKRMKPVLFFIAGRVVSYAFFGGLIGLLGSAFTPSPFVTGMLVLLAATYMIVMGLDMLNIAPLWLVRLLPRMPKMFARKMIDAEEKAHPALPFLLGGATFFLPCGFTQALQLYALTTGSWVTGALVLAGFALGTAPMLSVLGFASTMLKGKAGVLFFRLAGAVVIVLGLMNIGNGFGVMGYTLKFPIALASPSSDASARTVSDPNVSTENGVQVIRMTLGSDPFYAPSDHYEVKAGIPVRLELSGVGTGCRSIFQIPKANVRISVTTPKNVVNFTPKTGDYVFSCSMGMFRGDIEAI